MTPEELQANWKLDPTPDNLLPVLKSVDKVVNFAVGGLPNAGPQMKHQARLYAAEAIKTYDPSRGSSLSTHVQSSMQRLKRYNRTSGGPVKVADRAAIDAFTIQRGKTEFMDEHGREPDMQELSDKLMIPVSRIGKVNRLTRNIPTSGQMGEDVQHNPDHLGEALEYVYDGADHTDRRLIEMSTGYGGTDILTNNKDIAAKLNIHPSQVTRRNARIKMMVQDMERDLEDIT